MGKQKVSPQLERRLNGFMNYLVIRIANEEKGRIEINWAGDDIRWSDTTFGRADIFDKLDNGIYNKD